MWPLIACHWCGRLADGWLQVMTVSVETGAAVSVRDLSVVFDTDPSAGPRRGRSTACGVTALDQVSFVVTPGTFTAVMGPSGSGKSTLLSTMCGLATPTSGQVIIGGTDVAALREPALTRWRRDHLGNVFQAPQLVPYLSATENVELPLRWAGARPPRGLAASLLTRLGLGSRLDHLPSQLSGGQQQRVAIARALIANPSLVTADEPTGALDRAAANDILQVLRDLVDAERLTILMVTHDPVAAAMADRLIVLVDGRIVDDGPAMPSSQTAALLARHTKDGG